MLINLQAAWIGFLLGCLSGVGMGLFFHRSNWLGRYSTWPRRMLRLGHISFFGIGILNLSFALTAEALGIDEGLRMISCLLIVAAVTMPLVCYLSAARKSFRHIFFIPALSATISIALFTWKVITL